MKKLFFVLLAIGALTSCSNEKTVKVTKTGALVNVTDNTGIDYQRGNYVCIHRGALGGWSICNDGELKDTTYTRTFRHSDSTETVAVITHYKAVVQ